MFLCLMNDPYGPATGLLKGYFESGITRSYSFRRNQLLILKKAILDNEKELHSALYNDLKKNPEEAWVTETGFIIAEINHTIKHLKKWMKPEKAGTNLVNLPSKSFIYKEPLGVVLIIGPWNYPLQLLFAPLVGAIAAGNCVVLKPSEHAPSTAEAIQKLIESVFPKEYILCVQGEGSEVIPQLMETFHFNYMFYTGSTYIGKIIYEMAARQLIPVTLELGGKSPCVIEQDANIKIAAKRIALAKFSNAGQMCVAPDYLLVHESVRNELLKSLKETISKFYTADPSASYDYGKVINDRQFDRLIGYLKKGKVEFGGKYDSLTHFIEPTILTGISIDDLVMQEEIFGPFLPILSFNNFEEAKTIIQRNPDPLAFYLFTESKEKETKWLSEISFGGGCINNTAWHLTNYNLPFGGRGNSGIGRYHGKFSFDTFTHLKGIMKTPTWFDPFIKYPPFKGRLGLFRKIVK
jgi:aldehyde dehydrogenase (NAD+)